ncbi:MAG: hypothetical protein VYC64_12995 [Candidatus Latescibacterota bacterium]|nr:hypothetical protein [Candidatus Latescibacterota bacterium]
MNRTNTAPMRPDDWVIGALGVWMGTPTDGWRRLGPYTYVTNDLAIDWVRPDRAANIYVAAGHGLWLASGDPDVRWRQLHDETLTEVTAVYQLPTADVIAAGTYGVARATTDDIGMPRWCSQTEDHVPDERFTNCLLIDETGPWLAGTEAGVLVSDDGGLHWRLSDLSASAVRSLLHREDHWLAGTDTQGLWRSEDGHQWTAIETPTRSVFSIAESSGRLILGGYDGIHVQSEEGWRRAGPRALIRCLAAREDVWLAGADPGGLWCSSDEGVSWQQTGSFVSVHAIYPAQVSGSSVSAQGRLT